MKYVGSKGRIAKYILPIILEGRTKDQWYVEPFVGGGNMIDKVPGQRIGSDVNPNVINALRLIRDHLDLIPKSNKDFTEAMYNNYKLGIDVDRMLYGYIGFVASYAAKWFGGWSRGSRGGGSRDYISESYRNALNQSPKLNGIILVNKSYDQLFIPKKSIIYCDPPYKNSQAYATGNFDHEKFWAWCLMKSEQGHTVYVSEYEAPTFAVELWSKKIVSSLDLNTGGKIGIEKLFRVQP